jgi:lysophospholipase L1-like esterase
LRNRYLTQPALEVINMGLHGETAEEGAKRLPSRISQNRPEVLLLLEGANDLSAYGSAGIQRAWAALDTMAKQGRNAGLRVFIATLPPPRPGFRRTLPDGWITSLNDRIRQTARGEGAYLVDIYGALAPSVSQYIGIDGLHPSEAGYRKMAETFLDAMRVDLEAR